MEVLDNAQNPARETESASMASMFGDSDDEDCKREVIVAAIAVAKAVMNDSPPFATVGQVSVGGGRGIFATRDLAAGTLVVAEIPVFPFEDASQLDDPAYLMQTIENLSSNELAVDACAFLYPQKYEEADAEEREQVVAIWGEEQLVQLAERVKASRDEVIRRVLVLQHNGFDTGIYKWLSMANHSCAPNCIKFATNNSSGWASEIWTTQSVQKGEELTISYRSPLEMAQSSMNRFLIQHHRFQCKCKACARIESIYWDKSVIESINSSVVELGVNPSSTAESPLTVDAALESVEEAVEAMEKEQKWLAVDDQEDVLRTCKRMFRACDELMERTMAIAFALNPISDSPSDVLSATAVNSAANCMQSIADEVRMYSNITQSMWSALLSGNRSTMLILSRIHKCFANTAAIVLDPSSRTPGPRTGSSQHSKRRRVKRSLTSRSLLMFVVHSARLAELQQAYLGSQHPDLAGSHLDVAEGLRAALDLYASEEAERVAPILTGAEYQGGTLECMAQFLAALQLSGVGLQGKRSPSSLSDLQVALRAHKVEGEKLKALYATRRRYPEAQATLTRPGAVYWGREGLTSRTTAAPASSDYTINDANKPF